MNTIKKNIFSILVLLIALAIISYFLLGEKSLDGVRQDLKPAETTISEDTNPDNLGEITKVCYLKKTPSPTGEGLFNVDYVEVNYAQNAVVTGFVSHVPAGIDSQKGEFIGAQNGKFINVIYSGSGKGQTWKAQRIFKISDTGIMNPDYMESVADEEGTLMYKDISALTFLEGNVMDKVDCATVDKKEVGLE